jgi:hypothetical protein
MYVMSGIWRYSTAFDGTTCELLRLAYLTSNDLFDPKYIFQIYQMEDCVRVQSEQHPRINPKK